MNRGMRMSVRRHSSGCWSSTVTHNGTVHVAKSCTASPSDAALSALDLKRHLAFLAGSAQPVVHARFCACCSDGFGWVWNVHTDSAEPCPACNVTEHWPEQRMASSFAHAAEQAAHTGNEWLGQLVERKRHQLAANRPGVLR